MSDGKITIDAEVSAKRAEAQLLALENKMTKLADKIKNLKAQRDILPTEAFSKITQKIADTEKEFDGLADKMDELRKKGMDINGLNGEEMPGFAALRKQQEQLGSVLDSLEKSKAAMLGNGSAYKGAGDSEYDGLTAQITQAEAELGYLGAKWEQTSANMSASGAETGSNIKGSLASAATAIGQAYTKMCQTMVKGFQTMYKWVSKVAGTIKGALGKAISALVGGFRNIFTGGRSASSAISDFNKRLLNLIKAAFVFNVIRKALSAVTSGIGDAVKSFASYNSELNSHISALQTALAGLQGSIASAFAPIINAVVPILVTLINYLASAVNALGMFFSALTGKTSYTKLIANQKNYAGALNDTAKAAKAASNNLAKFDDLDVLNKDTSSGSGSSGSGSDFGGTEEVPIDSWLADLADMLKNGEYFDFGRTLADMISAQLEQIPWEEIRSKALAAGQNLAEILNGVFSSLQFAVDLGATLAQGINTALDYLYGFITSFDWTQFGVWWGYFFNGFVQTMDWNLLGETILAGINGIIASINAFFTTIYTTMQTLGANLASNVQNIMTGIDWTGMANTILMGITDITALLNGWNQQINWSEIADSMMNGINQIAQGMVMDPNGTIHQVWSENGTAVGLAIQNFLSGCHEFVSTFPFESLTNSISEWFRSAMAAINWSELGDTINQSVTGLIGSITQFISDPNNQKAIVDAITGLFEGLDLAEIGASIFDLCGALLDLFTQTIEEMDWTDLGILILSAIAIGLIATDPLILAVAAITLLLAELLLKLVEDIVEWCMGWMEDISNAISTAGNKIETTWNTLWDGVAQTIRTYFSDIFKAVGDYLTNIWDTLTKVIDDIAEIISKFVDDTYTSVDEFLNDVWGVVTDIFGGIFQTVSDLINDIWTTISDVMDNIDQTIEDVLDSIDESWGDAWRGMKDTLKGIVNGIIGLLNGLVQAIENAINFMVDGLNSIDVDIPDWVPLVGGNKFGLNLSHVSLSRIPTLANGGITTGATLAQIGEAGKEAVLPLEQNTEWIDTLAGRLAEVMEARTVTGINSVTMELNGQELARVALDDLVSEINRRGMTVDAVFA